MLRDQRLTTMPSHRSCTNDLVSKARKFPEKLRQKLYAFAVVWRYERVEDQHVAGTSARATPPSPPPAYSIMDPEFSTMDPRRHLWPRRHDWDFIGMSLSLRV
jgi:hypothetical protein